MAGIQNKDKGAIKDENKIKGGFMEINFYIKSVLRFVHLSTVLKQKYILSIFSE